MARGNRMIRVSSEFANLVKELSANTKKTSAEITREITARVRKP